MFFLIPTAPPVPNMETEAQGGGASCLIEGAGEFTSVQRLSSYYNGGQRSEGLRPSLNDLEAPSTCCRAPLDEPFCSLDLGVLII